MAVGLFDGNSTRAHHARSARVLRPWILVLQILTLACASVGLGFLFLLNPLGWLLLGLAAVPAMVAEWYGRYLQRIPIDTKSETVDGRIDSDILGFLPVQPSPQSIARALSLTNSGSFFAVRFGISGSFLEQLGSTDRDDSEPIWRAALDIAVEVGGRVSSGVLVLAMVRQLPGKDSLLGHLQLTEEDLLQGIRWYHHLDAMVLAAQSYPRRPGGIGRDWSFGWIPNLSRFGQNLSTVHTPVSPVRADTVNQIVGMLSGGRGSIAVVGQSGSGKSELIHELAGYLMDPDADVPRSLRYHQVFMLDAARLLSAAQRRGGAESLITSLLGEAFGAKNIVVVLDNAQLFLEEGMGSVDLSTVLLPILEAGRLPLILTVDEQRFLEISKRQPAIANAVQRINLAPTDTDDTMTVLEEQLPLLEHRRKVIYMYQALKEAYALSQRYVYDVVMPGQAVRLLDSAAEFAEGKLVTALSVQRAIEATVGVKTATVNDDAERETLLNLEVKIHERMVGQDRAVTVVSDALRRARAGVRNQDRPVGTFLFLGPTGVGKTELAKSLADVYYGGEDAMIRLDMNEFVSPDDVMRLIADPTRDGSSLTARIMKQPFSVILLDEIEKAHSAVLSTLLQLLDEGVLRDEKNREVSFKDAIVIATSNAGASRIQEFLQRGYSLEQFEDAFVDELINSTLFHPEFLNRFDEIVVFRPLEKTELYSVIDRIVVGLNKNLAGKKVTITLAQDAKDVLVEAGYDPRLGARPMRRVVQRAVESTVAKKLLTGELQPGESLELSGADIAGLLEKKKQADQIASTDS